MSVISRVLPALTMTGLLLASAVAQDKAPTPASPTSCTRDNALAIVQQQIDATRTFDSSVQRIRVLVRAADLIWTLQQDKARAALTEAFDLAKQNFKEKGDEPTQEGKGLLISGADQRYTVISAIAKHDSAWAKKLTDQMLKEQEHEAEEKPTRDIQRDTRTAERLLSLAVSLVTSDETAGVSFARSSLRYPATFYLAEFLYKLAGIDQAAAEQFYQEALAAYASAPMDRFLYLSAYPFGEAGDISGYAIYQVPSGFVPKPKLQRLFVQIVLRRAQEFINNPSEPDQSDRLSEPGQMWLALTRLERQVQQFLPDLAAEVEAARGNLYAQLPPNSQRQVGRMAKPSDRDAPHGTFDDLVEAALKNPNVDNRDDQLASAILGASNESMDHVLSAMDKIADTTLRQPLLNWLYFDRTQRAIKDQKLGEARKLAIQVEELDLRVWLYSRIAEESLKQNVDQTEAREMLEEVVAAALKAPNTTVTARALLGVAYLYTKIDMNRAVAVISEAVKCINRIEQPDFSRQFVLRKVEGKNFARYGSVVTPGFTPESAFREIGKVDFDGMLNQAANFSDKSLRALTTLAVVEQCLKALAVAPKPKQNKPEPTKP